MSESPDPAGPGPASPMGPSRLTPMLSTHFHSAVLVIEGRAITGFTPRQLADYAAMRTFAKIDPATLRDDAPASILTLFTQAAGQPVPITLTHWDLSYLRALYAAPLNRFAYSQRFLMRRQMLRDLERADELE